MTMRELMEHYIITTERRINGIQLINRNIITKNMGTITFVLANRCFLNKRNMISCFELVKQVFEDRFQTVNTKFKIEYRKQISICKIIIIS